MMSPCDSRLHREYYESSEYCSRSISSAFRGTEMEEEGRVVRLNFLSPTPHSTSPKTSHKHAEASRTYTDTRTSSSAAPRPKWTPFIFDIHSPTFRSNPHEASRRRLTDNYGEAAGTRLRGKPSTISRDDEIR